MEITTFSSGRINIIGEHIDYVSGFSIPASINLGNLIKIKKLKSIEDFKKIGVKIYSNLYDKNIFLTYEEIFNINKNELKNLWYGYIVAPIIMLKDKGIIINESIELSIETTLPSSAGLSSSASILCGIIYSLTKYFKLPFQKKDIAFLAKETENKYIGAPCGFLDQLSICFGEKNKLLFIDYEKIDPIKNFKSNFIKYIKLEKDFDIYVINSNVKHSIAGSGYSTRVKEKEIIQDILSKYNLNIRKFSIYYLKYFDGYDKLRKINKEFEHFFDIFFIKTFEKKYDLNNFSEKINNFILSILKIAFPDKDEQSKKTFFDKIIRKKRILIYKIVDDIKSYNSYDSKTLLKRLFHFVTEILRTLYFKDLIRKKKYNEAFSLLWLTHLSLSLFYEVSVEEIEFILEKLYKSKSDKIKGARIMGGGFGGSVIVVCEKNSESFINNLLLDVNKEYENKFKKVLSFNKIEIDKGLY